MCVCLPLLLLLLHSIFSTPKHLPSHYFNINNSILESECVIIKKLPLFSTVKDPGSYIPLTSTDGSLQRNKNNNVNLTSSSSTSTSTSSLDIFANASMKPYTAVSQRGAQAETFSRQFAEVFSSNILPPHILRYENTSDLLFLEKIGVKIISRSEFLRFEFLPILGLLMLSHPRETEKVLVYILEDLKRFSEEDRGFVHDLKSFSFIPTLSLPSSTPFSAPSSAFSSAGQPLLPLPSSTTPTSASSLQPSNQKSNTLTQSIKLYKPYELFDPNCIDLVALVDPDRFPIKALHGNDTLQALRMLGLCTVLDFPDIIACAHSIAQAGRAQGQGQGDLIGTLLSLESKAIQKRGNSLLIYLNNNISRFLNHENKDKYDINEREKEKEKEKNSFAMPSLLFGIRSLFVDKNTVKDSSPEMDIVKEYLSELKNVPWIPVCLHPTHPCMPWPTTTTATAGTVISMENDYTDINNNNDNNNSDVLAVLNRNESNSISRYNLLAAAVDCRPMSDAWHCSASKRLVNDCISDSTSSSSSMVLSPPLLQVSIIVL